MLSCGRGSATCPIKRPRCREQRGFSPSFGVVNALLDFTALFITTRIQSTVPQASVCFSFFFSPPSSPLQMLSALKYGHTWVQLGLRHRSLLQGDVQHRGAARRVCTAPPAPPHRPATRERGAAAGRSRDTYTYSYDEIERDVHTYVCVCESLVTAKH